ncbi:uncharacterized protein C2845_PM08G05400 [Panicum miliaceum]|uniref:Uncharacterized protein n=1 Tax=Panicum miliaceum TaxID=4540 RepID=A0A3L6R2M9_PANMI|nr:uncharacterized protein C2845_PM08G05400 [Panicum miliaceum]
MAAANGLQGEAAGDGGAPKLHQAAFFERGLLGLAAASTAITLAVIEPPPWLDRNAYSVALSGLFFAGMTQVVVADSAAAGGGVAGRKLVTYASLVVAAGLAAAASLLL